MTRENLARFGMVLYGQRWHEDLAEALGHTSARAVQRWASGTKDIPTDLLEQLKAIAADRLDEIEGAFFNERH